MRFIITFLLLFTSSIAISGSPFSNRFCLSPGTLIPDNDSNGITSTLAGINFLGGTVTDVDVQVEIDHTYVGDLEIYLSHDNSGTSHLIYDSTCSKDNLDMVLDDSATKPTSTCDFPVAASGGILPFEPLNQFAGVDGAASWSLTVSDNIGGDLGTLNRWCLFLNVDYNDVGLDAPDFSGAILRPADIPKSSGQQRIAGKIGDNSGDDYFIHNLMPGEQLTDIFVAGYEGQDANSTSGIVLQRGAYPLEAEILDTGSFFGAFNNGNTITLDGLPVYGPESILISIIDDTPEAGGEYYELNLLTSTASSTQTMWEESIDGDLGGFRSATRVRSVPRGTGRIIANVSGVDDTWDTFAVNVREGQILNEILLESYGSTEETIFGIFAGDPGLGLQAGTNALGIGWNNNSIGQNLLDNLGLGPIRGPAQITIIGTTEFSTTGVLPTYSLVLNEDSIFVDDFDAAPIDLRPPVLNELIVNLPGSDAGNELVELLGDPGATYPGYYFVSMEGDAGSGASGFADRVISLANTPFGDNGLLVIRSDTNPFTLAPETAEIAVSGFTLENGSNSFMVVYAPEGLTQGVDYDIDDDGFLEFDYFSLSWIADAVSVTDGGASDIQYGNGALFDAGFQPGAMTRFPRNRNRHDISEWYFGTLTGTLPNLDYSANVSGNFPNLGDITPGAPNVP